MEQAWAFTDDCPLPAAGVGHNRRSVPATRELNAFGDADTLLAGLGSAARAMTLKDKAFVYKQGDAADTIYYVKNGHIKLATVSADGKAAVLGLIGEGQFFGEGCLLAECPRRQSDATSVGVSAVACIDKLTAQHLLRENAEFAAAFMCHAVARANQLEDQLVDQVAHSTERRLARLLLRLTDLDHSGDAAVCIPRVTQETLAQMIGASRPRVNQFLQKFRRLGFIECNGRMRIHPELAEVLRRD